MGGMMGMMGGMQQEQPNRDAMWKKWVGQLRAVVAAVEPVLAKMDLMEKPFGPTGAQPGSSPHRTSLAK